MFISAEGWRAQYVDEIGGHGEKPLVGWLYGGGTSGVAPMVAVRVVGGGVAVVSASAAAVDGWRLVGLLGPGEMHHLGSCPGCSRQVERAGGLAAADAGKGPMRRYLGAHE